MNPLFNTFSEYPYEIVQRWINLFDRPTFDSILLACREVHYGYSVEQIFDLLSQLLPNLNIEEMIKFQEKTLPLLLQNSTPHQQQTIALELAQWYMAHANGDLESTLEFSLQGMHYFAKAIQIAETHQKESVKEIRLLAQATFNKLTKYHLIKHDAFKKRIDSFRKSSRKITDEDINGFITFTNYITKIDQIEYFCFTKEDHNMKLVFYKQAISILTLIGHESQEKYNLCFQRVLETLGKPISLPSRCCIRKYAPMFIQFRETFTSLDISPSQTQNVRAFQRMTTNMFQSIFQILLDDAFAILGSPPTPYDIRAIGSTGREEGCPYSNLEFMILIRDPEALPYFRTLSYFLETQIASIGGISRTNSVFTCIQTPIAMAGMQNNSVEQPETIENTALKTLSLSHTDFFLFSVYEEALKEPLISCREERAFNFFGIRLLDYKKHWKQPFNREMDIINIKQQYIELLNFLLCDMALFYGLTQTNTLDIIDFLVEKEVFTESSALLLKESVAIIYGIRIRLHLMYAEQKEEGSCMLHFSPFEITALEKCYWLILRPLYDCLHTITNPTDFKKIFVRLDLIQTAFRQNFSSETMNNPFIIHMAITHLSQINAPFETHLGYFKALSELPIEHPREIYLQVLEKNHADAIFQRLLNVPSRSGLRHIFLRDYERVKQGLIAITDPFDTQVPGQTVVCITASHFTNPRYLKPSLVSKIMNGENLKSEYTNSAHSVCTLNEQGHHFHLKQKPFHPLMEYAIHNLSARIAGKLTPSIELVRFEVHSNGRIKSYPVLISETISGVNLKSAKGPYNPAQYTWMLLLAILTRPGDGRLSNYIVGDNGMLYCVDNDISFVEPVIRESGRRRVYFCSALFCLTRIDTPLHVETLKEFASLDGNAIFDVWIEDIIAKEQTYISLFSKEELAIFYAEDTNNIFTPTIFFKEGALATLSLQFRLLQNKVAHFLAKTKVMTAGDLLKELISLEEEEIGTFVFKAYNNSETIPEKRLQQAISRKQDSITTIDYHLAALGKIPTLQEIEAKGLYSLQKAKGELFSISIQKNSEYATVKESRDKTVMKANFKEIKQETKRQMLVIKAITQQFEMVEPKAKTLIFHHCNVLTSDLLKPFLHNDLESLDLRCCEKIDNKVIQSIVEKCINLKKLLLAGCEGITEISGSFFSPMLIFPNLEDLDVSYCTNLHTLKLEAPALRNLKGTDNPILKEVKLISGMAKVDFNTSPQVALTHTKTNKLRLITK